MRDLSQEEDQMRTRSLYEDMCPMPSSQGKMRIRSPETEEGISQEVLPCRSRTPYPSEQFTEYQFSFPLLPIERNILGS